MHSRSLQSLLAFSALISGIAAVVDVDHNTDSAVLTTTPKRGNKAVTVVVSKTVTTCPSPIPPPPCSGGTESPSPSLSVTLTEGPSSSVSSGSSGPSDTSSLASTSGETSTADETSTPVESTTTTDSTGTLESTTTAESSTGNGSSTGIETGTCTESSTLTETSSVESTATTGSSSEAETSTTSEANTSGTTAPETTGAETTSTVESSSTHGSSTTTLGTTTSETNTSSSETSSAPESTTTVETSTTETSASASDTSTGTETSTSGTSTNTETSTSETATSTETSTSETTSSTESSTSETTTSTESSTTTTESTTTTSSVTPSTTSSIPTAACTDFWLEKVSHQGVAPFAGAGYKVFRNVKDYGAKGDGVTDDTAAINLAISEGNRCGPGCTGSTKEPGLVYFPPGTYMVSSPIIDFYYTQLIGNPGCMPVLKATADFQGRWLLDTNPYQPTGSLAWGATNVFWRQVANLVIDITDVPAETLISGIHWPSSQATSLANIVFKASQAPGTQHQGLFVEEGSGGYMGDLVFYGGAQAMAIGNQQFTMRNITVHRAKTAIQQLWSWGWTYKGVSVHDCEVAFDFTAANGNGELSVGSITILDSEIRNTPVGIAFGSPGATKPPVANNFVFENLQLENVTEAIRGPAGTVLAGSSGETVIEAWGRGHSYTATSTGPTAFEGPIAPNARPASLVAASGAFYERSKPQYEAVPASEFVSARAAGAKGDAVTDDTAALNALFASAAAAGKIVFLDAGMYVVTSTVRIPPGSRIVGEAFPVILSSGAFFASASDPKPVVQVGAPGEAGRVEWSNTIVSTRGAQPGAVLIEYNLASDTAHPSGLWDVHVRVGGFAGSDLQLAQCAKTPNTTVTEDNLARECVAAFLSVHVTSSASAVYMENCWVWVADHDLERGADNQQITVYAGRGLLVDGSPGPLWLVGSSVEHHQLYEYQLVDAHDVFLGQIQTETAYYQPNPDARLPFAAVPAYHDPALAAGESGWGLRAVRSDNVLVYGAGLYSFFDNYDVSCSQIGQGARCQRRILSVEEGSRVRVYNLNTVGTNKMVTVDGVDVVNYEDNIDGFVHTVALFGTMEA